MNDTAKNRQARQSFAPVGQLLDGPSGVREVFRVAFPLIISSFSWTVMTFVDRMMLRWVNGDSMSAAFQANLVWFTLLSLPLGICAYANTFVSQYHGDGQNQQIGRVIWQSIWFALACVPLLLLGQLAAPVIFAWSNHGPTIEPLEVVYFQILCWGGGGLLISQAASAFFSGRSQTRVVMVVDCLFALLNLILDYLLIFGFLSIPPLGIAGAGYATAISLWLKALTYLILMLQSRYRDEFGTANYRFDFGLIRRILHYGAPSGLQMFLDVAGFSIFCLLLGRLGAIQAEASSMAFSISSLAFMPIYGLALAATILVGQRLGENQSELAEKATWISLSISLLYMMFISLCYCLIPELFLNGFFVAVNLDASEQASAEASRTLAIVLLRFVAAYNLFDALLMVLASAIKGAGDTLFVMKVSLVMAALLSVSTYLSVEVFRWGIYECWVLITTWVCVSGLIFLGRFLQGKWKTMRVIEMQHPIQPAAQ